MNEYQVRNSPPEIGGVAAQTGWSGLPKCLGMRFLEEVPFPTTPSAPSKEASRLLIEVASTPPISGGEWRAPNSFTPSYMNTRISLNQRNTRGHTARLQL